ncbi:hypothetical protein EB093_03040 [bacterium]|nr:hypothetical protein [bacterium]
MSCSRSSTVRGTTSADLLHGLRIFPLGRLLNGVFSEIAMWPNGLDAPFLAISIAPDGTRGRLAKIYPRRLAS